MVEKLDYNYFVEANRNKDFIDEIINSGFEIELNRILNIEGIPNTSIWKFCLQGKVVQISFYVGNESIDFFTHEILHAYFIISLGFADTEVFRSDLKLDATTGILLPLLLVGHINNVFAHEKFFKLYLDRNFEKEKFTSDFNILPVFYKDEITTNFDNPGLPNMGILYFISTYFSCVDCRCGLYDEEIKDHFEFLKSKDTELFFILSQIWAKWEKEDNVTKNKEIISELITLLGDWYKDRRRKKIAP